MRNLFKLRDRRKILFFRSRTNVSRLLILLTALSAVIYFASISLFLEKGNPILFWLLIVGEIFHLWLALTYLFTIWKTDHRVKFDSKFKPLVDIYITVAGEPEEIVEQTALAAKAMNYPRARIYLLNDGFVAKKENWQEIERLATRLRIGCITRIKPGGAKAGNINNALRETEADFVAIFDADHIPHVDFLEKTMGYFADPKVAFVQTPQFYRNRDANYLTEGAWEQQEIFFGPILSGKNRSNAVFMCGTNMVVRKRSLLQVGGMCETNIAEDFATSILIHARGWKSVYVSEVLAEGLAPEDFLSYYKQQFRWARGSLEVLLKYNPIFYPGLKWRQRLEYLASASFYLTGGVVLLNAVFPIIFFLTGAVPFVISSMVLAAVFLPYIFLMIHVLQKSSNNAYTFRALSFAMGAFPIHLKALLATLLRRKNIFEITSKKKLEGNYLNLTWPHLLYFAIAGISLGFAIGRDFLSASVINNIAWSLFNVVVFLPFVFAAMPQSEEEILDAPVPIYDNFALQKAVSETSVE